jgi:hypothetical protein
MRENEVVKEDFIIGVVWNDTFELEEIPGEDYSLRENHLDAMPFDSELADEVLGAPLN